LDKISFLVELGCEELPASHLLPALEFVRSSFLEYVRACRLAFDELQLGLTPRRIALSVTGLDTQQEDLEMVRTGPAKRICYDENGALSPAAHGFLKKNQATEQDIFIQSTEKGEFIAVRLLQKGRKVSELLGEWLTGCLPAVSFPKKMIWRSSTESYSRPLRWIVMLLGNEIVPLQIYGLKTGNISYANRWLGLSRQVQIAHADDYFTSLQDAKVLADRQQRRTLISSQMEQIASANGLELVADEALLETVTDLVEFPTAVLAEFDPSYLCLPEKVITSTISQNQKYFSLRSNNRISNSFIFISNGDPEYSELIRQGNQKVVNARLADALWYYREDTKQPLEHYTERLKDIVFHSELGTVWDKVERILALSDWLSSQSELSMEKYQLVQRTAFLCKADLATLMLGEKEFTKLQGYMGREYALSAHEADEVADGIYEHYQPRGQNDALPVSLTGAIVAIADKMDTVCGIIGIGLLPTGSADPFALRRAANGIVQIIAERKWNINLSDLISKSLEVYSATGAETWSSAALADGSISQFFRQRINWLLKQQGFEYDLIESVLAVSDMNILDVLTRAVALQKYRQELDFLKLVVGFKRVSNIIAKEENFSEIRPCLLLEDAEKELFDGLRILNEEIDVLLRNHDYHGVIRFLVGLGKRIDRFFDDVLVNCEDPELRQNRYALLNQIRRQFLRFADISLLVIEQ